MDYDDVVERARDLRSAVAVTRVQAERTRASVRENLAHGADVRDRARNVLQFLVFVRARREQRASGLRGGLSQPSPVDPTRHAPGANGSDGHAPAPPTGVVRR